MIHQMHHCCIHSLPMGKPARVHQASWTENVAMGGQVGLVFFLDAAWPFSWPTKTCETPGHRSLALR